MASFDLVFLFGSSVKGACLELKKLVCLIDCLTKVCVFCIDLIDSVISICEFLCFVCKKYLLLCKG